MSNVGIHAKLINKIDGAYGLQGMTYTSQNNVVMAFYKNVDNAVVVREQNIETGFILKENVVTSYHSNSLTYNPSTNEILVAPGHSSQGEKIPFIVILDYDTLEFKRNQNLLDERGSALYPFGIAYNKLTDEYYILISNYSEWTVAIYSSDFVLKGTAELPVDNTGITAQGIETDGNYIYITRWQPQCIHVYDLNFNLLKNYNIPLFADELHPIIELEEICHVADDTFYCGFNTWTTQSRTTNNYSICQINLQKGIVEGPYYYPGSGSPTWAPTLWVDKDNRNPCPDGTSENPFIEIQDAINAMKGGFYQGYQISIKKAGTYPGIMIRFSYNNLIIYNATNGGVVNIEGAVITHAQQVTFNNVNFTKPFGTYNTNVRCEGANVKFVQCTFSDGYESHLYGYYFSVISNYSGKPDYPTVRLSHSIYDSEPWKSNENVYFETSTSKLQRGHVVLYQAGKFATGSKNLRVSANYFTNIKVRLRVNDAYGEYRYVRPGSNTVISSLGISRDSNQAQVYEMEVNATGTTFTILRNRMYNIKTGESVAVTDPALFGIDLIYGE